MTEEQRNVTVETLAAALDGWFNDGTENWRLVPMSEDGGLSVTSPASWLAAAIFAALPASAESGRRVDDVIRSMEGFAAAREQDVRDNRDAPDNINAIIAAAIRGWVARLQASEEGT